MNDRNILPEPDTHCFDEDTQEDVWSYSKELVEEILEAAANKAAEEGGLPVSDFQWRKKPVVIEAIQWPGCRFPETPPQWFIDAMYKTPGKPGFLMRMDDDIFIETLEGRMRAESGDWIIRGIAGEIYPCKPEIFEASYERASRQVANKAEVEPVQLVRKATDELSLPELAEQFAAVEALGCDYTLSAKVCGKLFRAMTTPPDATPPATTGASTARDQALEEAAIAIEDFEEKKRFVSFDEIANAIRALKGSVGASTAPANASPVSEREIAELRKLVGHGGVYAAEFADTEQLMACFWSIIGQLNKQLESKSVGASTVLTDERIKKIAFDESKNWASLREVSGLSAIAFARAIEREVAAQAGQVAVPEKRTELDGWDAAAKALAERAAGHYRNDNFELQDECLQCASMLHDLKPYAPSPAKESK